MNIDVNPKMLIWAREEMGMSTDDVVGKLKIEISDLSQWELSGKKISFAVLESIARLYKRQMAVFFLPDVPEKIKKPKDYRNLSIDNRSFSPETMLAIRRTERYLSVARELSGELYWEEKYEWMKNFDRSEGNIIEKVELINKILENEIKNNPKQKSNIVFRRWREKIEESLGIFVFQFPMLEGELDGFSYTFDGFPYAIVVNNQNAPVRKIFTLFHELFHIFKNDPGACMTSYENKKVEADIEFACNSFAAKFLVPAKYLKTTESIDEIFNFASNFNVSGEVYLRRLLDEGKISKNKFFELLDPIRARSESFMRNKIEGAPSMIIQSKSTRGNKFFNIITDAAVNNKISFSTASDLLGLKVGSIHQ